MKLCGHCAGRRLFARFSHQVPRRRPVAVAVEKRATDSTVQHSFEREVMLVRRPVANHLVTLDDTLDPKAFLVRGNTSETSIRRRVLVLEVFHELIISRGAGAIQVRCHTR